MNKNSPKPYNYAKLAPAGSWAARPKKQTASLLSQPPQDFREPESQDGDFVFEAVLADDRVLNLVNHFLYLLSFSDCIVAHPGAFVKPFFYFFKIFSSTISTRRMMGNAGSTIKIVSQLVEKMLQPPTSLRT